MKTVLFFALLLGVTTASAATKSLVLCQTTDSANPATAVSKLNGMLVGNVVSIEVEVNNKKSIVQLAAPFEVSAPSIFYVSKKPYEVDSGYQACVTVTGNF